MLSFLSHIYMRVHDIFQVYVRIDLQEKIDREDVKCFVIGDQ